MSVYAIAVVAQKDFGRTIGYRVRAAVVRAHSDAEAIGLGLLKAADLWPVKDGWYAHQVSIACFPEDIKK